MNRLGILFGLVLVAGLLLGCAGNPPADANNPTVTGQYASNADIQEDLTAADTDTSDASLAGDMDPSTIETTDSGLSESDLGN